MIAAVAFSTALPVFAKSDYTIRISPDNEKYSISENLYGIFLEDISYTCDGGLVSNLVNNNSFEYEKRLQANWDYDGIDFSLSINHPMNANNTHCAKITADGNGSLTNIGYPEYYKYKSYDFNGVSFNKPDMGFKEGEKYAFSCYVINESFEGTVGVCIGDTVTRENTVDIDMTPSDSWRKVTAELESGATADGGLTFVIEGKGTFYIDFVELIPESSHGFGRSEWKYVTLRKDMYDALEAMHPAFVRFPGGCLCEGTDINNNYDWKKTIGPVEERKQSVNLWDDDVWYGREYNNTAYMGYHEYFQLCADLGAEPVPVLNVALTCQGRNGYGWQRDQHRKAAITDEEYEQYLTTIALTPGTPEFDSYIQDIFDLIEYANGDGTTEWGRKRIENGTKEPFNLKYIGLGNENCGEVYFRNFDAIYKAVKERYPEITVISSSGGWLDGEDYEFAWNTINRNYPDTIVDEHYYTGDLYLMHNNERYDGFRRDGAKVFVGEYAATSAGFGTMQTKANIWSAVEEAGYLTGFERNGDVVVMSSYAPTFAKINSQTWDINLIWFDSQNVVLSPDYYVQMLYSNNTGNQYVKTELANGKTFIDSELYESVTVNEDEQVIYVKLVNASGKEKKIDLDLDGYDVNRVSNQYLSENYRAACNESGKTYVVPREKELDFNGSRVSVNLGKYSVNVVRIAYGGNNGDNLTVLPDIVPEPDGRFVPPLVKGLTIGIPILIILLAVITAVVIKLIKRRKRKKGEANKND
jgi:alpha-N-arabinofuranosidase